MISFPFLLNQVALKIDLNREHISSKVAVIISVLFVSVALSGDLSQQVGLDRSSHGCGALMTFILFWFK